MTFSTVHQNMWRRIRRQWPEYERTWERLYDELGPNGILKDYHASGKNILHWIKSHYRPEDAFEKGSE